MSVHEIFVLLNYISVFVMFACCAVVGSHSESHMQKLALLVTASLTMCCLGFLFRSEAVDADGLVTGQKLIYAFVTHGMFLMLLFILEYCKFSIPAVIKKIFHGINFAISFTVLTLDHHPFFYKSYWVVPMDGYYVLEKDYGFMHTVAVGLFMLYMAAAVIIAVVFSVKNLRTRSKYVWRLLVAVMLPCVSYVIPKLTDSNNDLQPMAFAAFSLMVLYMIYKNNLYDVDNIAARFSIASVDEALIVFDGQYRYQGSNERAAELFPVLKDLNIDCDIRSYNAKIIEDILSGEVKEYRVGDEIYGAAVRPIVEGNVALGQVIRLENITLQQQYTDFLKARKERLESEVVTLATYSYTDELTGLNNRRSFEEAVSVIRDQHSEENTVIGSVDLNSLKEINDTVGHAAGDEAIKGAADILNRIFSDCGKVYRTGGDEFYIILSPIPDNFDRLRDSINSTAELWSGKLVGSISFSYGFVTGRGSEKGIDQLLIDADKAMYEYKRSFYESSGRDRRGRN